jgi:hypothetical protein
MRLLASIPGLALFLATAAPAQEAESGPVVVPVPLATAAPSLPLRYALLPPPRDRTPGNAAPQWLRAGQLAAQADPKPGQEEGLWTGETPLERLPLPRVRQYLDRHGDALRLADEAARRERCDWELPPLTLPGDALPLVEVQSFRQLAALLALRCRLELAEGRFDDAARSLQTGLTLARHIDAAATFTHHLVAAAVASMILGRVEEWLQTPKAPNLYWPLTTLPRPLLDPRRAVAQERLAVYRSLPALRELARAPLSASQLERLNGDLFRSLNPPGPRPWSERLAFNLLAAGVAAKVYPDAKRALVAQGLPAEHLEAMPVTQVVLLHFLEEHDRLWDDAVLWMSVPFAQGQKGLARFQKEAEASARAGNFFAALSFPVVVRVHAVHVRIERQVAALRCVEAVRLHAAAHGGRPPATLAAVDAVPLPADPLTGKDFDRYRVEEGNAVLELPPAPALNVPVGRRYELHAAP